MGLGFGVVFFVIMIIANLWPIRLFSCIVEPSSQEDILLNHLCSKWEINTDQPKIEKMSAIIIKLKEVLQIKATFDKKCLDMISVSQPDPLIYRTLTDGPLWD